MQAPTTRYARSGDLSIAYQVVGDGPLTVVWVPGFVSNIELAWSEPLFVRVIERFTRYATLVMFDKRGTGLSDPYVGAPTLEERMDDVRAVMDDAGVERAALYGVSEGGPLAITFAATYPQRVSALLLYGTFAAGFNVTDVPMTPEMQSAFATLDDAMANHWGEGRTLDVFAPSAAARPLQRRFWSAWERMGASPAMARSIWAWIQEIDVRAALPVLDVPTLVLHQESDRAVPMAFGRAVADGIRGAAFFTVPGTDHVPFNPEIVDAFAVEVEAFATGTRPDTEPDRRLATVLFTDIVDSTRRSAEAGDAAWGALVAQHDELMRGLLREHHGHEVKTMGDGFLATFEGPGRAVDCTRAFVSQVEALGLHVRAGIHAGECAITIDDVRGMTVNIAARVAAMAGTGEVLVTKTLADLILGSGTPLGDRGSHELKGVPGRWQLLAVTGEDERNREPLPSRTPARSRFERSMESMALRFPRAARASVSLLRRAPSGSAV